MRVLVTGHLGYIGTVLVPVLLAAGHEVVGLDTRPVPRVHVRRPAAAERPDRSSEDLRDVDAKPTSTGIDAVVHLAALSNDPLGDLDRS